MKNRKIINGQEVYSTTEVGIWLGLNLSATFMQETLGLVPTLVTHTGIFWYESDLPKIAMALSSYARSKAMTTAPESVWEH